jgi:hypothetical protein
MNGASDNSDSTDSRTSFSTTDPPADSSLGESTFYSGGLLRASNRKDLAVCVEALHFPDDEAVQAEARLKLEAAFANVMKNSLWQRVAMQPTYAGPPPELLAKTPARIEFDCPVGPAVYDPVAGPVIGDYVGENLGRSVQVASPYLFHVYVLPEDEISRFVGSSDNFHFSTEEVIWDMDVGSPVTIGLYFSPGELDNMSLVVRDVEFVIGLR